MPQPKKRRTTSDKGKRRSHHALKARNIAVCSKCGGAVKPHHLCLHCGFYNGRDVLSAIKKSQPATDKAIATKVVNKAKSVDKKSAEDSVKAKKKTSTKTVKA